MGVRCSHGVMQWIRPNVALKQWRYSNRSVVKCRELEFGTIPAIERPLAIPAYDSMGPAIVSLGLNFGI